MSTSPISPDPLSAPRTAFGVDIGGTGIKGGVVNLVDGTLVGDRVRIDTPQPATPDAVSETVGKIVSQFEHTGPFGITFPGVVNHGVVHTAANMDASWIGTSLVESVGKHVSGSILALNDADAAGLAEVRYGAGRGQGGVVIMVTFGTGIGIAILNDGKLVPNAELGHLELDGHDAEDRAAASAKERDGLNWEEWSQRADKYLRTLENLLWPDLFIVGGGISKKPEKWVPHLHTRTPIAVAAMKNNSGIVGAALAAAEAADSIRIY